MSTSCTAATCGEVRTLATICSAIFWRTLLICRISCCGAGIRPEVGGVHRLRDNSHGSCTGHRGHCRRCGNQGTTLLRSDICQDVLLRYPPAFSRSGNQLELSHGDPFFACNVQHQRRIESTTCRRRQRLNGGTAAAGAAVFVSGFGFSAPGDATGPFCSAGTAPPSVSR